MLTTTHAQRAAADDHLAGLQLPTLLSGALVTETVFAWPGMGRLFLDSHRLSRLPAGDGHIDVHGAAGAARQPAGRPALCRRRPAHAGCD